MHHGTHRLLQHSRDRQFRKRCLEEMLGVGLGCWIDSRTIEQHLEHHAAVRGRPGVLAIEHVGCSD